MLSSHGQRDIVLIGGSAGSLLALQELLPWIPEDLEAAILLAVHPQRVRGTDLLPPIVERYSLGNNKLQQAPCHERLCNVLIHDHRFT